MNQQDKDRLRELAVKVGADIWHAEDDKDSCYLNVGPHNEHGIITDPVVRLHSVRDAAFIAAANPQAILSLLEENEALAKKSARYDWLRRGDNDEKVLIRYLSKPDALDGPTMYLPREVHLDAAIDAAMQPKGA